MKTYSLKVLMLFLLAIELTSCQYLDSKQNISLEKNENISISNIFSGIEVIPLETKSESLIHSIKKIEYHNSCYYILDERAQKIFCFDENGRFVFKIDSQGRGPGEYNFVTDFAIDRATNSIILLDPVLQKILFFDIYGKYLYSVTISSEEVMGYNGVYALEDSVILLTSITNEQLIYYCLKENMIKQKLFEFEVSSSLEAFMPKHNVYQFNGRTYALPALQNEIFDVTEMKPVSYYKWCFGRDNNSQKQINNLIAEIKIRPPRTPGFIVPYQAVGSGKILNHHIVGIYENNRFMIAWLEFDSSYTYAITDKKSEEQFVFSHFQEGTVFPFENLHSDRAISYYKNPSAKLNINDVKRIFPDFPADYLERNLSTYNSLMLSESCMLTVDNHNPMTDNPFLVVYKFKE